MQSSVLERVLEDVRRSDNPNTRRRMLAAAVKSPALLTLSQWSDRYRMMAGPTVKETGHYRSSRTPYVVEIMDALSEHSPWERVVVQKGSQIGLTEVGNCWVGYVVHHCPGPMLYVEPTLELARSTSKERIAPMIAETDELRELVADARSRRSNNTILVKTYPNGILTCTGANSAVGLRSRPAQFFFGDEVDGYPPDVGGEGDPLLLCLRRVATWEGSSKSFIVSTPTLKGLSRIAELYKESDQRVYLVPCPHCGEFQEITWESIRWPEGRPELAFMSCVRCGSEIDEAHKTMMLAAGRWQATAAGDGRTAGFHISALYSPQGWYSWGSAARDFLAAKARGPFALQVWTNTVLGKEWDDGGEAADPAGLLGRAEQFPDDVPAEVLVLTAAVDVQGDRVELEVVGWDSEEQSWGIEKRVLWGDPHRPDVWADLDLALQKTYRHASGYRMQISATCVDSGYAAHHVYQFCKNKEGRRIWAVKGDGKNGRPLVGPPSKKRTGRQRRPVRLFTVGTDQGSAMVHGALRVAKPGPAYCHFPAGRGYDALHFDQLCSMTPVIRYTRGRPRREWKCPPGRRNEAFDLRVYAWAALYLLQPTWEALTKSRARQAEAARARTDSPPPAPAPEPAQPPPPSQPRQTGPQFPRRKGKGWINRFR